MEEQLNWTAHRSRGYGVGSLNQKGGEPDKFWVQPGHALAEKGMAKAKGGRFEVRRGGEGEGGSRGMRTTGHMNSNSPKAPTLSLCFPSYLTLTFLFYFYFV